MSCGKTTWGRKLAAHLDRKFVDLDHLLVEKVGMVIPEYFQHFGEARFRELESQTLKEIRDTNAVISTGGGCPCHFDNMEWIKEHGTVLYLRLTADALFARLKKSDVRKRPALKGLAGDELKAFIVEKLAERERFYAQAHIQIDPDSLSLEEIWKQIEHHQKAERTKEK